MSPRACRLVLALTLAAGGAWAQDAPVEAEHLRGMALFREHRDGEAREVFRALVVRTNEPRALARLAATEAALGEWVDAESHLRAALAAAGDPWVRANRTGADGGLEGDLRRYASHVGRLEVRCETPGAEVWVGGVRAATLPMTEALRVAAGSVTFEVRAPGHVAEQRHEDVPGGADALVRVSVALTPSAAAPPVVAPRVVTPPPREPTPRPLPAPVQVAPTSRPWFAVGLAATGVGVAGLVLGVTGLVLRNGHATTFNNDPGCGVTDGVVVGGATCQTAYDDREPGQTLAAVGFIAGGALLAAGVTVLVVGATSAPRARRTVTVTGAPGELGAGLRVAF